MAQEQKSLQYGDASTEDGKWVTGKTWNENGMGKWEVPRWLTSKLFIEIYKGINIVISGIFKNLTLCFKLQKNTVVKGISAFRTLA